MDTIIKANYVDEMKSSYIDYALMVIMGRALPDVRDGLKPVHRRILYSMLKLGLTPDKGYRKSARVVGDVLGTTHPHGDSAVYLAMVRMAQDFKLKETLVKGHGNFGSIDGDSPAAMRYTEAKLDEIAYELMLKGLEYKGIVDFKPNFDGKEVEPVVLPSILPNLLVNGSNGVAVGMRTEIPTHNMNEVCNAIIAYINNKNITTEELLEIMPGPDYPTGGYITNKEDMLKLYETGKGSVRVRGKVEYEDAGYGKTNIVITEIPYSYSGKKGALIEKLVELVKDKKIEGISDIRDESGGVEEDEDIDIEQQAQLVEEEKSDTDTIRIIVEVKKGIDAENIVNLMYKKGVLEDSISYNFLVINKQTPEVISLKKYFELYLAHQQECTLRKYEYLIAKESKKHERLEGLIKAIDLIDVIIECLRGGKTLEVVKSCLMTGDTSNINFKTKKYEKIAKLEFNFTEIQTQAILGMNLQRLIGLEIEKLSKENNDCIRTLKKYNAIIKNEKSLNKEICKCLTEANDNYPTDRKTIVTTAKPIVIAEVEEVEEDLFIIEDRFGYIKAVDENSIKRSSEETLNTYKYYKPVKSTDKLMVFTDNCNVYQMKISDIPKGKMKDKGEPIDVLLGMDKKEKILIKESFNDISNSEILFVYNDGLVRRVSSNEFISKKKVTVSTKLYDNELVDVVVVNEDKKLTLTAKTNKKKKHKVKVIDIPTTKKGAKGCKKPIIALSEGEIIKAIELK